MLDTIQYYVVKNGELTIDTTGTYKWVGGSPLKIDSSGELSGDFSSAIAAFSGVAYNSWATDDSHPAKLGTYLVAPCFITIKKASTDTCAPWYAGLTYSVGDILRPAVQASGATSYACWTNAAYASEISNSQYVYWAKIIAVTGAAAAPTALRLQVGTNIKTA
jgi:hypothetical protein